MGSQIRLFLHTAAYWLLHQLCRPRPAARRGAPQRSNAFLKIAVRIEELNTRIRPALAYPIG